MLFLRDAQNLGGGRSLGDDDPVDVGTSPVAQAVLHAAFECGIELKNARALGGVVDGRQGLDDVEERDRGVRLGSERPASKASRAASEQSTGTSTRRTG